LPQGVFDALLNDAKVKGLAMMVSTTIGSVLLQAGLVLLCAAMVAPAVAGSAEAARRIAKAHPRVLGSLDRLKALAKERPEAYARMATVARGVMGEADDHRRNDDHASMISLGLVSAIEADKAMARRAVEMALTYVDADIRHGHVTFGHDLGRTGLVYDLCHAAWTEEERQRFITYFNATVDANVNSETHVFHNAWYGYKHWGYGISAYATYYENPRAEEILAETERDWRERAAPALELAGAGGGFAEGYYVHYWLYEWVFFTEVARLCEGKDYYEDAPAFFRKRAIASMFEMYPGIREYGTRRPIPIGDGGGRRYGGDRDKALSARRILVNRYRDDVAHQAAHTFNETTPVSGGGTHAYKDFLWRDETVPTGDLADFPRSHISEGPGYVYARSSWNEDAVHFFFKSGDRFTAHQHLDVGNFLIYKHEELAGDGGQYYYFGGEKGHHDVNYHLRTIAHSTMLVHDPEEVWPGMGADDRQSIRAGKVTGNDGGQHHNWPHHNGATSDPEDWYRNRDLYDVGDILAFEDTNDYVYVGADCKGAYDSKKLSAFTRQIVYVRPGTFVIFDRVTATDPSYKKTWLLQAMKPPVEKDGRLVVTNGKGRLFVQTLLPREHSTRLAAGDSLYTYGGNDYTPEEERGAAPECRVEVSPAEASQTDLFLHVLTATDSTVEDVRKATVETSESEVAVTVGGVTVKFETDGMGGRIVVEGEEKRLAVDVRPTVE